MEHKRASTHRGAIGETRTLGRDWAQLLQDHPTEALHRHQATPDRASQEYSNDQGNREGQEATRRTTIATTEASTACVLRLVLRRGPQVFEGVGDQANLDPKRNRATTTNLIHRRVEQSGWAPNNQESPKPQREKRMLRACHERTASRNQS